MIALLVHGCRKRSMKDLVVSKIEDMEVPVMSLILPVQVGIKINVYMIPILSGSKEVEKAFDETHNLRPAQLTLPIQSIDKADGHLEQKPS